MDSKKRLSASHIRYLIKLYQLSSDGVGVKNIDLAKALGFSKPSVHNMLKYLSEMDYVEQRSYGLAHLTHDGREIAQKYAFCFDVLKDRISELCGDTFSAENAVCTLLAELGEARADEMYKSGDASRIPIT